MAGTVLLEFSQDGQVALLTLGSPEEKAITLTPTRLQSFIAALDEVKKRKPKGLVVRSPSVEVLPQSQNPSNLIV